MQKTTQNPAQQFSLPLEELEDFNSAETALAKGKGPVQISGCVDSEKIQLAARLGRGRLCLFVTYSEARAAEAADDAAVCCDEVYLYRAKDLLFYQADVAGNLLMRERMEVWEHMMEGGTGMVITTIDACMDMLPSLDELFAHMIELKTGQQLDLPDLERRLAGLGYSREAEVNEAGQFAVRGGIIDIFPLTAQLPVRIELWGDEIDMIRTFDPDSQRSLENIDEVHILPATDEGLGSRKVTFPGYFGPDAFIFLDEPMRLKDKADVILKEFSECMTSRLERGLTQGDEIPKLSSAEGTLAELLRPRTAAFTALDQRGGDIRWNFRFNINSQSIQAYHESFDMLIKDLNVWKKDKYRVVLFVGSSARGERLANDLRDYDLLAFYSDDMAKPVQPGQVMLLRGDLHRGFSIPMLRFVVLAEGDLFGKKARKKRRGTKREGTNISRFSDLKVGDYVIHEAHGLGVYRGTERMELKGVERDFIKITYADGGNLYIPVTQLDQVQRFAGAEAENVPKLNRLGGSEWHRTKTKAKGAVRQIAEELVRLYSARLKQPGFAFGQDTVWQKEFEEQFPYEETDDQLAAIEATKADMESSRIMDRLICGDVGYGKTEIAIRAAFKAVQDGKQVAFLAPTTILAQQHYNTFIQRMKDFPVNVRLMSRFRTQKDQKETVSLLKSGMADIVIGTHRILSKDVSFKNLGLLIIDEEQRFGVTDKEKIKQLRMNVDVLALTATPIPRTLHMSLVGIRDMSVLEEAPSDRVAIQTFVMEYDDEMVREAIEREIARDGQVYYVYNRVHSIGEMTARIARLVPDSSVAFAHGQMKERELERIMLDFINGDIDVLVTTTIIETGLDISNVNTIIIHDADRFGLSQLYQLRGRVGRSNRTAYAFLMYRRDKMLKEIAEKRLSAIREYSELGSGIRVAMRDLELRGAGNLLGAEQHGHLQEIGYDYYCKLMEEAVRELKGEKLPAADFETNIDLSIDAFIPNEYIPAENQKMNAYRRIASIETPEDASDVTDELMDRYGDPPAPVRNLLEVAQLKALAHDAWVTDLTGGAQELRFTMHKDAPADTDGLAAWIKAYRGAMTVSAGKAPVFVYRSRKPPAGAAKLLSEIRMILEDIRRLMRTEE